MTVEEYLLKRVLELEEELKNAEKTNKSLFDEVKISERTLEIRNEENKKLKEKLKELTNESI